MLSRSIPPNTGFQLRRTLLISSALLLLYAPARAASDSWTGATSASWNASNWSGNNPPQSGDSLVFGSTTGGFTTLSDNLMMPAAFTIAGITFEPGAAAFVINPNTAGTNGFTLSGSIANLGSSLETINDIITLASGTQTITTTSGGGNLTLGGTISGVGALLAAGSGTLTLSGTNTFSGGLVVENGSVLGTTSGTTFGTGMITLGDANTTSGGATLLGGGGMTYANAITTASAAGSDPLTISNISGGNATFSGSLTLNNNLVLTGVGPSNSVTLSGSVTGSGNIIASGSSGGFVDVNLSGNGATWTGNLIVNTGTVETAGNEGFGLLNVIQINSSGTYVATSGWNAAIGGITGSGSAHITNNYTLGGTGSYTFSGVYDQSGGTLYHYNSGTQVFSGATGTFPGTQVNDGEVELGSVGATSTLTETAGLTLGSGGTPVTTGSLQTGLGTLLIAGNYTINLSGGNAINVQANLAGSKSGGLMSLEDGSINTLSITTPNASKTILEFQGSSTQFSGLAFDVGNNTSDQINGGGQTGENLSTPGSGEVHVTLNGLGGITAAGSSYLMNFPGDTGFNTAGFTLISTTGNFSGFTTVTLAATTNSLQVTWSNQTPTPGTAYWDGNQSGTWSTLTGGTANNSNWSSTAASVTNIQQVSGSNTNVLFSVSSGGANTNTVLGANFTINTLEFTSAASGANSVSIGGAANTLTITASGTNNEGQSNAGITVDAGAGNVAISTNVALGGAQTWAINNSGTLNLSGTLSGASPLTVSGNGELILGGNNTFTGGLAINSGTVELNNPGTLNSGTPQTVTFGPGATSSTQLQLNGQSVTVGGLFTNSTPGAPVVENGGAAAVLLTDAQSTSGTYAGTLQNGGSGALSFTMAGAGTLTLSGTNTYSGSTTVNSGILQVTGSLGSTSSIAINSGATLQVFGKLGAGSPVAVNNGGTLSGTGGTIGGAVTVNNGGTITAGTAATPGKLTLSNGLTITGTSGGAAGIAAFNIINGGANDEFIINGGLTLNNGAILEVTGTLTSGTYVLATYTSGPDPSLSGITEDNLSGGALGSNYIFTASSGTLELVIGASTKAVPSITIASPAPGIRVMLSTTVAISGTVSNSGPAQLNGTLSDEGLNLAVSGFSNSGSATVSGSSSAPYSAIVNTGTVLGLRTYGVTVSDPNASPTSTSASSNLTVLANRVVSVSISPNFGIVHAGTVVTGTITLSSTGADNNYTRVTVADSPTPDANGVSVTGGNPSGTFNGSFSDNRTVGGTITNLGAVSGTITLLTGSEGLAGELPVNVPVIYSAQVFSGTAAWAVNTNGSWATNGNWGDLAAADINGPGAPGLAGSASIGDTATFSAVAGLGATPTVSLNGATPTLAGITFTSATNSYTIAAGTGGAITLQGDTTPISITTGSDTISAVLTGDGFNKTGQGILVLSGTNTYTGSTEVSNGILQLTGSSLPATTVVTLGDNSNDSGELVLGNSGTAQNITIAGLQTLGTGAANSVVGGGLGTADSTLSINVALGATFFYGGVIGGTAANQNLVAVIIGGTGTQVFSGTSTYNGGTTITGGTLGLAAGETFLGSTLTGGPIGTGTLTLDVKSGSGGIIATAGPLSIDNVIIYEGNNNVIGGSNPITFNANAGSFTGTGGNWTFTNNDSGGLTFAGPVYLGTPITNPSVLKFAGTGPIIFSGSITDSPSGTSSGQWGLQISSTSQFTLSNPNNTYTGTTTVNSGTLVIAAADTVVSGVVTKGPLGLSTLDLQGGTVMAGTASPETIDNPVILAASSTIGGGSNLTFTSGITSTAAETLTITGPGNTIFTGTSTYTGTTVIASGNLVLIGSVASSVNPTGGTLSGTGVIAGTVTTGSATGGRIAPGVNTSGNFGASGTLTLNTGLTLGNGTILDFDLGTSSDLIAVTGQLTLGTGITVVINPGSGFSPTGMTTYTLITYSGALTGNASTWTLAGQPITDSGSFASSGGVVTLTIISTAAPANAWWSGAQGSGGSGTWNTVGNGVNGYTNWLNAFSGGIDTYQVPYGGTTNVFFIANSGSNTNTFLGANTAINSLNFTGTNATVTTGSAISISGSAVGSGTNYTLTINATGTNGNTAGSGITTAAGAGVDTINAPLALGGNQTWTLNAAPADPLVVNGPIGGSHSLTVTGSGELILGGSDTFTGGLTIDGSVNVVLNNPGALNSTNNVTFGSSSSGTLNLAGNSTAIGSLSSASSPQPGATPQVIQNKSSTPATLAINQTTGGTFTGNIQDGAGGGSLSLVMAGSAPLILAGSETYSGSTTINGGFLGINGSLTSTANVTVNGGTLGGSGTIAGPVTVNAGGAITATAGTGNSPATLTLTNGGGLTINSGGIVAFNVVDAGANDLIAITSGGLTMNSGAIVQIAPYLTTAGTYALITYAGATNITVTSGSLNGITEEDLGGGALQSNYSFAVSSGTLELVVTQSPLAVARISLSSPVSGSRVMSNTILTVSGTVSNTGNSDPLSGTLSNTNGFSLTIGNFSPTVASVAAKSAEAFSGTIASTGAGLGNQTYGVTVTDGSSINISATASGTVDVLANRVVTPTVVFSTGSSTIGAVHAGTVISGTVTLSSTGADIDYTRVMVANAGPDAFGISVTGGSPSGTFNGSLTDTRFISGTLTTSGTDNTITLLTSSAENGGAGLAGEVDQNVVLTLNAQVFSGHATWNGSVGNSSWSTNANWGDISTGVAGAPGLSGALSNGDTAIFTDGAIGEVLGGTTTVNLNGASPSLFGITFSSGSTVYNIATGTATGGVINLQNNATMSVTTGTGMISAVIGGAGPLTVTTAPGSDLIWSGSDAFTGSANITSGTLTLENPTWLGQSAGTNVYNISSGAVLQWNVIPGPFITDPMKDNVYIDGSGTLQITGAGIYISLNELSIQMAPGSVIEVGNGATLGNGGSGGPGGITWTYNRASLQLDSGGSINIWDNYPGAIVDALTGSGTVNRIGFGNGANTFFMGVANGSGTFNGTITNGFGTLNLVKEGSGTEVLTGNNSYSGSTAVTGGVLKITTNTGLGFGAQTFIAQGGQFTTTVSGGGTLDISGGLNINEAVTLSGGSLVNNTASSTSTLASGVAGITFTTDPGVAGTVIVNITGGSGSLATGTGGYVAAANFSQVYSSAGANNNANDYVQVTASGSGYMATGTGAPVVSVTINGAADTGTDTAVISSLALSGLNNFVGGNGNLTINAQIIGTGGFTTVGTGTLTLTNAETYTGLTTLGAGTTLVLGTGYSSVGSIGGSGSSVIVTATGTVTFAGANTYTAPTTIASGATLQLGNGITDGAIVSSTIQNNGALVFHTLGSENLPGVITGTGNITMNGVGNQEISGVNNYTGSTIINSGTLQLGSTTALGNTQAITVSGSGALSFTNGATPQTTNLATNGQTLTLSNGSTLTFGMTNTSADLLDISNGAVLTLSGTTYIDITLLSGTGGSYTIITDSNPFQGSGTFALAPLPALATGTLTQTGSTVSISYSGVSTAYWEGSGTSGRGNWGDYTNFTSDAAGTVKLTGTFGPTQDIVFSASGATKQTNNALNTNVTAQSLTINDPSGVDIGTAAFNFYTLTLAGSGTHNSGITVGSAAGALGNQAEIDANIDLAGTPNITVNSTAGLLITGGISGTAGILVNGANTLTLTGSDTFSGGVDLVSGTLSVSSDGAFGQSGAGNLVTFNPGAGNSVTLQQNYSAPSNTNNLSTAANRTFDFVSGTGIIDPGPAGFAMTIGGPVIGTGAMELVDSGQLILSGSVAYTGTAFVTSGTLTLSFPGTLAQTGSSEFRMSAGAVLQLSDALSNQNISPASGDAVAFTGSGTLQVTGLDTLQLHGNAGGVGNIYIDMGAGSTIEVVEGMLENGGPGAPIATEGDPTNGTGSPLWTGTYNGAAFTNLSSLQIDATGTFDTWNGNNVIIDALNGSGVLTRLGYSNTEVGSIVYIGDNNGSGEFDGIITNLYGSLSIVKEGTGVEIFTGSNSYSGSTLVSGGILRVENNNGLGFGGPVYYTGANTANQANGTVTVTGSSTLDLNGSGTNGAIVVDKVIVLNGATLVNNGAGSMATLDNGVAAISLGGTQSGTYSFANLAVSGTAPGNGSGASFAAGTGAAPGGSTVFGKVTAPGTGYTIAPTLVYSDQTGTGSGVTATAILSSLSLGGSTTDYIGGSGTLVVNAVISGSDGFTTTGTGTLILNGSNTYAGATIVATDTVQNNGYITGVVNVNPTGGGISTLSGTGIFGGLVSTAAAGGGNVAHIAPGVNAPGSNFGGAGTLTMKNSLVLGNGTNLDYDLGANTAGNSDQIVVSGSLSLGSGIALNIGQLAGFSQGTYVLMTYTGALSGNTGSWTVSGLPNDTATLSTSTAGEVTLTISGVNDSQLVISPAPIQLGSVLVGYEALSATVTLSNTDALANGSTAVYTNVTGGNVTVSPSSGTLASNTSTNLTVGTGTISGQSGNGVVIGTLASTNSSNASGSAAPVTVEANVYQPFSGSTSVVATSGSTATLYDTNAANTDGGGGQRAGATISAYNSPNANFVITPDPTSLGVIPTSSGGVSSGSTSVAEVAPAADLLNGTYNTTETITGTAAYSDPQLAQEASVAGQVWNNVTLSATISGVVSTGSTNVYSAQILSGSSYAGYSLSSGVVGTTHTNTGPGGLVATTATLLAGTASATNTVNMSFDITPGTGSDNAFRTSDILTLTGLAPRGTALEDGQTIQLTDEFVLQMTYDVGAAGTEYIAENTYNGWINAVLLNGPQNANSLNPAPYNEPYSTYAAANPNFSSQLGAYGYYQGVAWAVLDNTGPADPISEYAVIPEPGTYALIFGGFGMLAGFRRLRKRRLLKS